jgi:hypothetical protein
MARVYLATLSENIRGGRSLQNLHTNHLSENAFPTKVYCIHKSKQKGVGGYMKGVRARKS